MCQHARCTIDEGGQSAQVGERGAVPWWSFTKLIIATAALRLVEQGRLSLDERAGDSEFTLRQLLRHEAGLPDYGWLDEYHAAVSRSEQPWPKRELIARTLRSHPPAPPGSSWAYSNIGYFLVVQLICEVTGQTAADALQSLALERAGLTQSHLASCPEDLFGVVMGEVAACYHPGWVLHGLLVGPIHEAAEFLLRLLQGRLLGSAMLSEMLEVRALPEYASETWSKPAYGLGIMGGVDRPSSPCGHSGEGPGSAIAVFGRVLNKRCKVAAVWRAPATSRQVEREALGALSAIRVCGGTAGVATSASTSL